MFTGKQRSPTLLDLRVGLAGVVGQRDGQEHEGERHSVRGTRLRVRTAPISHGSVIQIA